MQGATKKRRNGKPKRLEAQKNIKKKKGEAQKLMRKEERKGKEAHVRGLKKTAEPGSLETAKRLGIPQVCKHSQEKIKTIQKKKTKRNTRNRGEATSFSSVKRPSKKKRKESATSHSTSG